MTALLGNNDLFHRRYEHSFLEFTENAGTLPPIDIIGELEIRTVIYLKIAPGTAFRIISRLLRLRTLQAEFEDDETDDIFRNRLRQGMSLPMKFLYSYIRTLVKEPL